MAVKEIKDMGTSVLTKLKKQAKETGINYQTCLQLFTQEEFLRKLEMSRYVENLVLKGGCSYILFQIMRADQPWILISC